MKSLLLCAALLGAFSGKAADSILLWPGEHAADENSPSITPYLPEKGRANGAGVIVVPGGSFLIRCEDHEGTQVAKWFARHGVTAFVAHYRLIPRYTMREELDDVRRAVQLVRSRAGEFGLSPSRIGIIGFSAGAYLAGEAALKPLEISSTDPVGQMSSRPDFLTLVYGAPGGTNDPVNGFNRFFSDQIGSDDWKKYTATTMDQIAIAPPTFSFCTGDDRGAARRMGEFHLQLMQKGVSSEAHFFANGPHGVGFAQGDPILGEWPELMLNWLRGKGFLTGQDLLAVNGIAKINGEPLQLGYLVFKPVDHPDAPVRTAYIFNRSGPKGGFQFPQSQGLEPGKYRVEIYQMAKKWSSVWAEPLLNRIQGKLNSGEKLTDAEIGEWKAWAETRKYEATQSDLLKIGVKKIDLTADMAKDLLIDIRK